MNDKLLQHLESAVQTSGDIPYLRRLILDMAVRGQLLPQNKADESIEVLLNKIAAEKQKVEKNQSRRVRKTSQSVGKDDAPFPLPKNWKWVQLQDIGNIFSGNSINEDVKQDKYTNIKGGIPYIGTKDVGYGWDALNYENGVSIPQEEPKFVTAYKGAVLMCFEGGSSGKKCGIADRKICFGNKLVAVQPYGGIAPDFILSVYQTSMFGMLFSNKTKGERGGISIKKFESLMIPLSSLVEQKRIVAQVKPLMLLCNKLEMSMDDLQEKRHQFLKTLSPTI